LLIYKNAVCFLILFACVPFCLQAQLCSGGSLGDPYLNFTFSNTQTIPFGSTAFTQANDCPNPGEYLITNFCFGCDSNNLYLIASDHTRMLPFGIGDNVMFVNAAGHPGTVFTSVVQNLCPGITYQFSAWIANVMKIGKGCGGSPAHPNLTLSVMDKNGDTLAKYNTNDILEEAYIDWQQYGCSFTAPANVSAVTVTLTSNSPGKTTCGSMFLVDDITLTACGSMVSVSLDGGNESFVDVCAGYTNPFLLKASYLGFNNPVMVWQNSFDEAATWQDITGETNPAYQIPRRDSGTVLYRLVIAEAGNLNSPACRFTSNIISITLHQLPPTQPLMAVNGCLSKDYTFPYTYSASNFTWAGPNGFQSAARQPVITNIQQADTGLYTVQLFTDFNCTAADSFYLTVSPSVTLSATKSYSVCQGTSVQLQASGGGTYLWTPPTGLSNNTVPNPIISNPLDSVKYQILIANTYGCMDSATVAVNVYKAAYAYAGPDKSILLGDTATLDGVVQGTAVNYYWSPATYINNTLVATPQAYPPADMQYTLTVNSTVGCGSAISVVKVSVYKDLYIPNAFTPNGDGRNDIFRVTPLDNYTLIRMTIYNRWGTVVFNTTNAGDGWDGTFNQYQQPPGAYIYYLEFKLPNGKRLLKNGTVVLMR